ncbi:microtubule organization protein AKNA isoform X2 [Lepisosteus oculatus]|uniref:microtubule organization protein AKNA isoform X2 n=1 Tax=Lepisosteus oculatus TaxID=7918 RepID=UPI0037233A77
MSGYRMASRPPVCTMKGGTSSADGEHARGEPGGGVASPTGSTRSGLSWGGEGTGSPDHDLDFHSQMDENGIIGLGELPEELEGGGGAFSDAGTPDPEGGPPPAPASPGFEEEEEEEGELFGDLTCDISELQDSEPLGLSASLGEEDGLSLCDSEEMEEDAGSGGAAEGGPWRIHRQRPWRPQSDGQLEMSEDEREGAASTGGASEDRRDSPDDSGGDDRWTGGSCPEARMTEVAPLDRPQETAEGRGVRNVGGGLSAPAWSPQLPVQRAREPPTASRDSVDWTILSRFSSEDLANGPDIEAETFPESSFTESVAGSVSSRPSRAPAGEGSSPRGSTESGGAEPRRGGLCPFPTPFPPESGGEFGQGDEEAEDDEGVGARAVSSWMKPVPGHAPSPTDRNSKSDTPRSSRPAPSRSADGPGPAPSEPPARRGAQTGNHGVSRLPRGVSPKPSSESSGTPVIEPPRYGRGPLNHPLPDFSRVGPRVRIPKDGYRPPRGRGSPQKRSAAGAPPLVFKSPAEIVREVLLSGPDGAPAPAAPRRPPATHATVPEEFRCPQQASALVHQLQEDYNRLLTKYAEAENTIDRLRLSAKVSLYASPPRPSPLVHSGAVHQGSKVMTLTFPQAQRAELGPSADPAPLALLGPGQTGAPSDLQPAQACAPSPGPGPGAGGQLTEALARQAERFRLQIDSFEDLLKTGTLKPYEQMKGLASLQQAQDSLERSYLQAREQQRHLPPQDAGVFDPDREVEGQIFRLGMRLEDLTEQVEQTAQRRPSSPAAAPPSPPPMPDAPPGVHSAPTPHPESPVLPVGGRGVGVAVEVSSVSGESEEEEGEALPAALPAPLRHKHQCVEGEFSNLLDQYQSFRELPALLDLGNRGGLGDPILGREACAEVSGIAGGEQGRTAAEQRRAPQQKPVDARDGHLGQPQGRSRRQSELSSREPLPQASRFPQQQGLRGVRAFPAGGGAQSRGGSLTSVGESGLPAKVPHGDRTAPPQERIVSPETDSGFVGSESSRLTPAVHSPYHQRAGVRYPSGGRAQKPSSSAMKCPAPHHRPLVEDRRVPRDTVSEVNVGRNALPLPSPSPTSSPQHWASSVTSEFEPETYATLSDSEREEDGPGPGAPISCSRPANRQHRQQQSPSPPLPYRHGDQPRAQASGLLPSRHEAIQALQVEVSRLKQSLEGSLHRTAPPSPAAAPPTAREDQQPLPRHSSTPAMRALQREEGRRQEDEEPEREPVSPAWRRRSASAPRLRAQWHTGSDSDRVHTLPRPRSSRPVPQSPAAPERGRRSGAVAFRGPYTGRQYTSAVPGGSEDADPRERSSSSCPRCSVMTQHQQKTAHHHGSTGAHASTPSPRHCPLCRGTGVHTPQDRERWAEPGASAESNSGPTPRRSRPMGSPQKEKRGVFVAAPSPPLLCHVPVVQCVPICTPVVYYPAPLARAPPSHLEPRLYLSVGGAGGGATGGRGPRSRSRHARSLTLAGGSREQSLSLSLSRAISAARGMREASRHMARSLTAGLEQQGALRQPCL